MRFLLRLLFAVLAACGSQAQATDYGVPALDTAQRLGSSNDEPAQVPSTFEVALARLKPEIQAQGFHVVAFAVSSESSTAFSRKVGDECSVWVTTRALKTLSRDAMAFMLGHEIAHCALQHSDFFVQGKMAKVAFVDEVWNAEYDADAFSLALVLRAGLSELGAVEVLSGYPEDNKHASGIERLKVLFGGQARTYKRVVNLEHVAAAQDMHVNESGAIQLQ